MYVTSRLLSRKWKWKQLGLGSSRRAVQVYGDCDWLTTLPTKQTHYRGVERHVREGGGCQLATGTWDTKRFREATGTAQLAFIHVHILNQRQTGDKWLKLLCFRSSHLLLHAPFSASLLWLNSVHLQKQQRRLVIKKNNHINTHIHTHSLWATENIVSISKCQCQAIKETENSEAIKKY